VSPAAESLAPRPSLVDPKKASSPAPTQLTAAAAQANAAINESMAEEARPATLSLRRVIR
jgi:hypothetical protein